MGNNENSEDLKDNVDIEKVELKQFPLLPLRDILVFPGMVMPLFIGRNKSILALDAAMASDKMIFLSAQKNSATEEPAPEDIYTIGTLCQIIQMLRLPNGTVKVLVEGKHRGTIKSFSGDSDFFVVDVELFSETLKVLTPKIRILMKKAISAFETYLLTAKKHDEAGAITSLNSLNDPDILVNTILGRFTLKLEIRQEMLTITEPAVRLRKLIEFITSETEVMQLDHKIKKRVNKQMEKNQREYYLNEQLKAIHKELGKDDTPAEEFKVLEDKLKSGSMSKEAREKGEAELKKLKLMAPMSAEAAVIRNYLETLIGMPWGTLSKVKRDIKFAEQVMEEDHYGLEKVKRRIFEYLAVQLVVKKLKGPILCLVGPPGVGKTSLAKSIARATSRKFVKMSLGGLRDEAEIRGHRRTYIGAMPGKILLNIKKAGVSNPVFLLDEIDKLGSDFRGDPASALLEVLDPEQNSKFNDHFLEVEYDLSKTLFVATANTLHTVPRPLLDRLEVIRLEGYIDNEKLNIAKKYLVPKQLKANGLLEKDITFSDETILKIISGYTRESGVRALEKEIAAICRKVVHNKVKGEKKRYEISPADLTDFLGPEKFRNETVDLKELIGVVNGLAWTESGGDILQIEVSVVPGKGTLIITGQLGDVMNESAQAAMTYVRSRYEILELDKEFYHSSDIHIHVPEGAIPKDGPSAGITMATALVSALTGKPVRSQLAMTGEISLQGRVLPIGGLKEKLMAARRSGIKTILIPKENVKDLLEIPEDVKDGLVLTPVAHMDEVLTQALSLLDRIPVAEIATDEGEANRLIAH
ncbi:MAG: endopeptidase La [Desulfuromonadales bacterium]|nr:endopeptidase La [Desulfuromonadales bacterium]